MGKVPLSLVKLYFGETTLQPTSCITVGKVWKLMRDLCGKCHILTSVEPQCGETISQLTSCIPKLQVSETYAQLMRKVPDSELWKTTGKKHLSPNICFHIVKIVWKPRRDLQRKCHLRNSVKLGSGGSIVHLKCRFPLTQVFDYTCRT